jgi:hypothetical protein
MQALYCNNRLKLKTLAIALRGIYADAHRKALEFRDLSSVKEDNQSPKRAV